MIKLFKLFKRSKLKAYSFSLTALPHSHMAPRSQQSLTGAAKQISTA